MVMAGFPLLLQALTRLGRSSVSCTVLVWTATFWPQALSGWIPVGVPFLVPHCVPALKSLIMLTCCLRSSLMVNDETPSSYLPDSTPGMIAPNLAHVHRVVRPS